MGEPLCPATILKCSRIYSHRYVPRHLAHMRDDIAADATLRVLEETTRGFRVSTTMWRWAIYDSMRSMCGDRRTRAGRARSEARYTDPDSLATDDSAGDLAWCVARLREAWPTLTSQQQLSVTHWLLDEVTPGIHPSVACRHRIAAFGRVRAVRQTGAA